MTAEIWKPNWLIRTYFLSLNPLWISSFPHQEVLNGPGSVLHHKRQRSDSNNRPTAQGSMTVEILKPNLLIRTCFLSLNPLWNSSFPHQEVLNGPGSVLHHKRQRSESNNRPTAECSMTVEISKPNLLNRTYFLPLNPLWIFPFPHQDVLNGPGSVLHHKRQRSESNNRSIAQDVNDGRVCTWLIFWPSVLLYYRFRFFPIETRTVFS